MSTQPWTRRVCTQLLLTTDIWVMADRSHAYAVPKMYSPGKVVILGSQIQ